VPEEHILIGDDEEKIAGILEDYLVRSGYRVSRLDRGARVMTFVRERSVDLILLDLMLPGMEGMEVCKSVRRVSQVPIIMVTARVEEIDRLIGLEIGADDYVCKPFSPREVVARVKAVLRRTHPAPEDRVVCAGGIEINGETRQVTVEDIPLKVTPTEFRLIKILVSHPGRVFTRNELVNLVQGYEFEGYDRTIDSHIKNLRKKLSDTGSDSSAIESVYGEGYRFSPKKS
jgi:two-component system response regulator BaeR